MTDPNTQLALQVRQDLIQHYIIDWIATGETGASSLTMAFWLAFGTRYRHSSHPYDPDDFRRCVQLLKAVPGLRSRLSLLTELSPEWAAMVSRWDDLEELLAKELPGGRAPLTYALMLELRGLKP